MISEQEYQNNKEMISWLEKQHATAQGSLDQSMRTLRKEFKCKNLKEVERLMEKLKREQAEYESEYRQAIGKVKKKYKKQLKVYRPEN